MRLNSTGVAEGYIARDRKVTVSSLNTEVFFFFNFLNTGVDLGSSGKVWSSRVIS